MTASTLFSGFGGAVAGMADLLDIAYGVEYDEDIADAYEANFGPSVLRQKVQDVDWHRQPQTDFMQASPPCPAFSVANANKGETAADLEMADGVCRAIRQTQPRAFVLENVEGYKHSCSFVMIQQCLHEEGYLFLSSVFNSANFGVAQTRRRLILRAVKGRSVPDLRATHAEKAGGGLCEVAEPWNGWYAAIEDLIPFLKETKFAPWQERRLKETMLVWGMNNTIREPTCVEVQKPAPTVTAGQLRRPSHAPWAFLVGGQSAASGEGVQVRVPAEPSLTVRAGMMGGPLRAFMVDGANAGGHSFTVREREEPALTITAGVHKGMPRAFIIDGRNTRTTSGEPWTLREEDEPVFAVTASDGSERHRAFIPGMAQRQPSLLPEMAAQEWLNHGRVVAMDARCLARFQSLPDWMVLPAKPKLACQCIGNAIPSLLMRRIAESLMDAL